MPNPNLIEKLMADVQSRARPMGICINLESPSIIELAPRLGFSWTVINQDHTLIQGRRLLAEMIRTADAAGLPHLVQLGSLDSNLVQEALDLGSYGVILPGVETVDQVEKMLSTVRYPPLGTRSMCSVGRNTGHSSQRYTGRPEAAEAVRYANEHALLIPTIATSAAIDNLDDLMSIESCPIWHLSFSNLNLSFGLDAEENPRRAIRLMIEIAERIHAAGRYLCAPVAPMEGQTHELAEGMEILGNDLPYALDATCLAFGMDQVRRIAQSNQGIRQKSKI